jgi:pimeloyl-ACP methyl ester carboxylesterase
MNPFFFGDSAAQLYGVHHPPRGQRERSVGVVLCAPFGQEYMRSHRAFRQLALLLSRAGFHVLRFDYSATGDSAGDGDQASIAQWTHDTRAAIDELKETAGVDRVALVGLRLGALVAALAAEGRGDVAAIIHWDPAVSGRAHLEELLAAEGDAPETGASPGPSRHDGTGTVGVMGFPVTATLRAEMAQGDLCAVRPPRRAHVLVVSSQESEAFAGLESALRGAGATVTRLCLPSPGTWSEVDNFGSVLIPQGIIQQVVAYLSNEVEA